MKARFALITIFILGAVWPATAQAQDNAASPHERILYSFGGGTDGNWPEATLIADGNGTLYGTTGWGGGSSQCAHGCGTVFKLTSTQAGYTEHLIYAFDGLDGAKPLAGLIAGASGSLFGTTTAGGAYDDGIVFELSPAGGIYGERVLHTFHGGFLSRTPRSGGDGAVPWGTLIADASGALYGTTFVGGTLGPYCYFGCGTVFKLTPNGSEYKETILHNFGGGNQDGMEPFGNLVADASGALYGTTFGGGGAPCPACGTVFKLIPAQTSYREQVLHFFHGYDGLWPQAGLAIGVDGSLYGTTTTGGTARCRRDTFCGTVFKLSPAGSAYSFSVLHNFKGGKHDGANPKATLLVDSRGVLYGTTTAGGYYGSGVVFRLAPRGSRYVERILHSFRDHADGDDSQAGLLGSKSRLLYGTTTDGGKPGCGADTCGVVFSVEP